jgi:hypothetical protein
MKRHVRNFAVRGGGALFVLGLLAVCWTMLNGLGRMDEGPGPKIVATESKLSFLLVAINRWLMDDPDAIQRCGLPGSSFPAPRLLEMVRGSKRGDVVVDSFDLGQCLVDSWGRPVRVICGQQDKKTGRLRVSVVSWGPNGLDEQGCGDDLAREDWAGGEL